MPVEQHIEGSAGTDSEEDNFDQGRQHSVVSHKAGLQPFRSKVLTMDEDGNGSRHIVQLVQIPHLQSKARQTPARVASGQCARLKLKQIKAKHEEPAGLS